jgi:predicted dehydrogenase
MQTVRVAVIGLGLPGIYHAHGVIKSGAGVLEAICELNDERRIEFPKTFAKIFKEELEVPVRYFSDVDRLLEDPDIDAVVVALPNALHYPVSLKALQHGKHVLCEKPPTLNAGQMEHLRREAEERGLIYFFGRQMRFSSNTMAARRVIAERRLGEIYFAESKWIRTRGTPSGIGNWFLDRSKSGGGALIDIGVHVIDTAWFLMGVPRPESVFAQTYQKFPQLVKAPLFDVEDSAYGMIRFETGATLQFQVSWAANLFPEVPESKWAGRELFQTTLYGPKGSIRITDVDQNVPGHGLKPIEFVEIVDDQLVTVDLSVEQDSESRMAIQMRYFLRAIEGVEPPINSAIQATQLMEMLDAIYKGARG